MSRHHTQLPGLNRRRSESLLLALGQLILIAYFFQVAAFDHWQTDPAADVTGIARTSAHAAVHSDHCHGGPSSCAEAGGEFAQVSSDQVVRLPSSKPALALDLESSRLLPEDTFIASLPEPPRAAV